jgi:hypothetical protein
MPSSFPSRNLTTQYISSSYQEVVQNYSPAGGDPNEYFLDGLGNVLLVVPTSSITQVVITSDITSSMSVLSASHADVSSISDVSVLSETASIAANSDFSISSSWASQSLFSDTASYVYPSGLSGLALPLQYTYKNSITAADPGKGCFRYNSLTTSSITEIYIDIITDGGLDITTIIKSLKSGSYNVYVQQKTDNTAASIFEVRSTPVDNIGWFTIPVSFISSATTGIPSNNSSCIFLIINENSISEGGSYPITSSWAISSFTSSYITSSNIVGSITSFSGSWASQSLSASYITSSNIIGDITSFSSSWASSSLSASYITSSGIFGNITSFSSSWASQSLSSSYITSSNIKGNITSFSSSWASSSLSASYITASGISGVLTIAQAPSASYSTYAVTTLSASWASQSLSASYITSSNIAGRITAFSSSWASASLSASIANTASYITSSNIIGNMPTSSYSISSSFSTTSSFAISASWAPSIGGGVTPGGSYDISASWASSSISSSYSINSDISSIALNLTNSNAVNLNFPFWNDGKLTDSSSVYFDTNNNNRLVLSVSDITNDQSLTPGGVYVIAGSNTTPLALGSIVGGDTVLFSGNGMNAYNDGDGGTFIAGNGGNIGFVAGTGGTAHGNVNTKGGDAGIAGFSGGNGGDAPGTGSGVYVGGNGSPIFLGAGNGGVALGAPYTPGNGTTGGSGGGIGITAGNGGGGTNFGGIGGSIEITAGNGGGSIDTGSNGGSVIITLGTGGVGLFGPSGNTGSFIVSVGDTKLDGGLIYTNKFGGITAVSFTGSFTGSLTGIANTASYALTSSMMSTNTTPYVTLTTGSNNDITCSLSDFNEFVTLTVGRLYIFTSSNPPSSGLTSLTTLYISNISTTTSSLSFPVGWIFVGAKPQTITGSKNAVLTLQSFGDNTVAAWAPQY